MAFIAALARAKNPGSAKVDWKPGGVTVAFESGESVQVPADKFRKVR